MICVSNIKSNSLCFNEVVHKEFHWVDRCLWIMTKEGQKNHHIWHILERKRCSDSNRNLRPLVEETTGSQRESGTSSKHVGGVFKKYKLRMLLLLLGVWWCHVSCLRACGFQTDVGIFCVPSFPFLPSFPWEEHVFLESSPHILINWKLSVSYWERKVKSDLERLKTEAKPEEEQKDEPHLWTSKYIRTYTTYPPVPFKDQVKGCQNQDRTKS